MVHERISFMKYILYGKEISPSPSNLSQLSASKLANSQAILDLSYFSSSSYFYFSTKRSSKIINNGKRNYCTAMSLLLSKPLQRNYSTYLSSSATTLSLPYCFNKFALVFQVLNTMNCMLMCTFHLIVMLPCLNNYYKVTLRQLAFHPILLLCFSLPQIGLSLRSSIQR